MTEEAAKTRFYARRQEREELKAKILEKHGLSGHPKADILFQMAWDRGHADGLHAVESEADELVNLLDLNGFDIAVLFLADLNGSNWISGDDPGSADMRQRAKVAHQSAFAAKSRMEFLEKRVASLHQALLPFARYERVRIDPVVKTNGKANRPKEGILFATSSMVDDQETEAKITVEDMTLARKLTGV